MKYRFTIIMLLVVHALRAQNVNINHIFKSWVISKVSYDDDTEVPDNDIQKYIYIKYTFYSPDKFGYSLVYYQNGGDLTFEIKNTDLLIKNAEGYPVNAFTINQLNDNSLVITQKGFKASPEQHFLKYYYIPEEKAQSETKLTAKDISGVANGDTIYNENPKTYALFKNGDFHSFLTKNVGVKMDNKQGRYLATFVVNKSGLADSLVVLEHISAEFDNGIAQAFKKSRKNWRPAILNGKPVSVKMNVTLRYMTSATVLPKLDIDRSASQAFKSQDYETAKSLYTEIIDADSYDTQAMYMRGLCNLMLGNNSEAINDWLAIKKLGSTEADRILEKYYK